MKKYNCFNILGLKTYKSQMLSAKLFCVCFTCLSPFLFFFSLIDIKEDRQEEERRKLSLLLFYLSLFTSVNSWSQITDRWPWDGIISVWGNLTALEKSMQLFLKKLFDTNFVVWSLSHVWLFGTPWTATHLVSLFFTISQSLLKLMSIESMMLFSHLNLCCPLLFLPSIFTSIRVFSNE